MPREWDRKPGQAEYLNGQIQNFIQAQNDSRVDRFLYDLYEGWFKSWPAEIDVFGNDWQKGDPVTTLADKDRLGAAIEKRKDQLYTYVRWRAKGKVIRSRASGVLKQFINKPITKRPRKSHKLEVYSKKYYKTRFKNHVDREVSATAPANESKKEYKKRQMTIYRKWRASSWQTETDEVKAEIEALWDNQNAADNGTGDEDADGEPDPDESEQRDGVIGRGFGGCIDQLGDLLTSFLRELQIDTGWSFTLLGGGLNREGDVKIVTSHVGKTAAGSTFPQVCNKYQDNIIQEFLTFVNIRHPIEERLLVSAQAMTESSSPGNKTSQTDAASGKHDEERPYPTGAIKISVAEQNPGPLTKKGKRIRKRCNKENGGLLSDKPAGSAVSPGNRPGVDSPFSESSPTDTYISSADPSMRAPLASDVPVLLQDDGFQPTPLWTNSIHAATSAPFGYSTPSLGYYSNPPDTLYHPDANWMIYGSPSFATPMMPNVQLPYDNFSPMSGFLARSSPNQQACNSALPTNPSLIFFDTTNSTLTNNMNIPTQPIDANSHPYLDLDSTLPPSKSGFELANEAANMITRTRGLSADRPVLPSEPENSTEANFESAKAAPAKARKRTRKDEVDASCMLPEGTTRAHKPRQMADETCWEGPVRKRSRKRV